MTTPLRFLITADDKASAAFAKIRGQLTGMEGQVGALGTALRGLAAPVLGAVSVAGLVAFVRGTVNGIDALNDLKDATGASIENLSALEDVALRSGSSLETAGAAVLKLNQALQEADDPGSKAAAAFKALGLNVKQLQALDPVIALQRVGRALASFADDASKGRLQYELLGKSTAKFAALLKDLAEAQTLTAKVTTAQAEEAEKFNKQLAAMSKNASDLARTLAGPLVSALSSWLARMQQAQERGAFTLFGQPLDANARAARLQSIFGREGGATGSWGEPDPPKDGRPSVNATWEKLLASLRNGNNKKQEKPFDAAQWLAGLERDLDIQFLELDQRAREREAEAQQRRVDSLRDFAAQLREENARLSVDLIEDDTARAKAQILLEEQVLQRKLDLLGLYGEEYEQAQQLIAQNTALALRGVKTEAKQAQDAAKEVGLVFASAAGQAITQWSSFRDLLKGIGADLLQILVKTTVTDPLSSLVSGAAGGFNLLSALGFRASGGPVAAGAPYIVGERGPELFVPRTSGHVLPSAGGVTVVQNISVGGGASRNEVAAAMVAARDSAVAAVSDAARRGRLGVA